MHHRIVTELFRSHNDTLVALIRLLPVCGSICFCAGWVGGGLWVHGLFDLLKT